MKATPRRIFPFASAVVAALVVAACGGSHHLSSSSEASREAVTVSADGAQGNLGKGAVPIPSGAVAQVGNALITRAQVNHWMSTLLGGDFYENKRIVAPKGLVADPPDYPRCVASLRRFAVSAKPSTAELEGKCHELNEALKQQALELLIESQWSINRGAELGLKVGQVEIQKAFNRLSAREFPTVAALHRYLALRGWTLSVELDLVRRDLLGTKLLQKLKGTRALTRFSRESTRKDKAETSCRLGYVVESCREYSGSASMTLSPAVLIEQIAPWK
jgi:hypothetical protein